MTARDLGLTGEAGPRTVGGRAERIEADLDAPVLAVAMQRLDVIAAQWEVWSCDEETARAAVNAAALG